MSTAKKIQSHLLTKYQALFEQASDPILTVLEDGSLDEVNHAFQEMTGFTREELAGKKIDVLSATVKTDELPPLSKRLTRDLLFSPGTYEDVAFLKKDRTLQLVDVSVRQVESADQVLHLAILRDVTEKKRIERELIVKHNELQNAYTQLEKNNMELKAAQELLVQSGKMAALGELAAGIAHELNQPLQGIRGYAQELQEIIPAEIAQSPKQEEVDAGLKEIISNVDKMANIIQYLRTFTRKSIEEHEFVDVHEPIGEALKMLSRQFAARGIFVHKNLGTDLPKVYANPLQLEQVFINLSTNARDAIEASARGSGNIWIDTRSDGEFVEISFRDDGCGMSDVTKTKAFNPFFTTKEVGKGMGLGLSLSYGILNKIHGSIVVKSEAGKGTTFEIRLPRDFRETG